MSSRRGQHAANARAHPPDVRSFRREHHSSRWHPCARPTKPPRIRHGDRMQLRRATAPLIFAAVLITSGCVAVPPTPQPPSQPSRSSAPAEQPSSSESLNVQQPAGGSDELAVIEDDRAPKRTSRPAAPRSADQTRSTPHRSAPRPPARRPAARPAHRAPTAPRRAYTPPRRAVPQPRQPTRPTEMRSLCRTANGVVTPEVAHLCHGAYGR